MLIIGIVMILALAFFGGYLTYNPTPQVITPGGATPAPGEPAGLTSVTKQVKLVINDFHGGAAATGTTDAIDIYAADGKTTLETDLDLSAGSVTTAKTYASGTVMWVSYIYAGTPDERMWWQVTVPQMTAADAESLTTNLVTLKAFSIPTAASTTDLMMSGQGATYAAAAVHNTTGSTNDTGTFTYSWYIATDGTGFLSSRDPIYAVDNKAILWATVSGTGYETVSLTGWDSAFTLGSTKYYYHVLTDSEISKWKVGNQYEPGYSGVSSFTFSYNAVGYSNSTTAYVTLGVYLEVYSDVQYMKDNGAYGPNVEALCSTTVLFEDTS